jgi:adenylate cyclase
MAELADHAGVTREQIAAFWQVLGLALPPEGARAFTPIDVDALIASTEVVDYGVLGAETETSLLRAVSHTAERLAWWQVESLVDDAAARFELDGHSARLVVVDRIADLADIFEGQMVYAWRKHLAEIIRWIGQSVEADPKGDEEPSGALPLLRAVGFADLVGYSAISAKLDVGALDALVGDFTVECRDLITRGGGRVVKELGDGIMFATDEPIRAAQIALELAETIGADQRTPPARVGMVWGRVLGRFGDLFGPPVNLASRLTALAAPGEVVVDQATADLLGDSPGFVLGAEEPTDVAGVGRVRPYRLARAEEA